MSREKALKRINEYLAKQQPQKVELALVQDIIKDAEIAKGKLKALINVAARRQRDYNEVLKIASKVGVDLDGKIKEAGRFFIDLDNKLS